MLLYFRVSICRCYKDHVGYSVHYIVLHQGAALTIKWTLFSPNCGQHITCNVIAYMFDVAKTLCNCACSMPLWLAPLLKAAGRLKTDRARRKSAYRLIQRQSRESHTVGHHFVTFHSCGRLVVVRQTLQRCIVRPPLLSVSQATRSGEQRDRVRFIICYVYIALYLLL